MGKINWIFKIRFCSPYDHFLQNSGVYVFVIWGKMSIYMTQFKQEFTNLRITSLFMILVCFCLGCCRSSKEYNLVKRGLSCIHFCSIGSWFTSSAPFNSKCNLFTFSRTSSCLKMFGAERTILTTSACDETFVDDCYK